MPKSAYTSGSSASWWIGALACLLLFPHTLGAQSDLPSPSAWHLLPSLINPSHFEASSSASLLYGSSGKDRQHYLLHGSFPLSLGTSEVRLGATISQAKSRLWSASDLTGRASIPLLEGTGWHLSSGIELNFLRRAFDGARALSDGITDSELPTTRTEGKGFDFGLGLLLTGTRLQAGLSAQHLLATELSLGQRFSTQAPRWIHSYLSYRIGSLTAWSLSPRTRLSLSNSKTYLWQAGLALHYSERYQLYAYTGKQYGGLSLAIPLGHFLLGYTWERHWKPLGNSHEFLLSYRLPYTPSTPRTSSYTSIRLL